MKRLIKYSETPQITALEYNELFDYRKEKNPIIRLSIKRLINYRTKNDKAAYFDSMKNLHFRKRGNKI